MYIIPNKLIINETTTDKDPTNKIIKLYLFFCEINSP